MENVVCATCSKKPKSQLQCGLCECTLCKNCSMFVEEDQFSFMRVRPAELMHTVYCGVCYDQSVAPQIAEYNETMERARNILVFDKSQGKETRLVKRLEDPIEIKECLDRDETILRLAFFAAESNFNAIVDLELKATKVKTGSRQSTIWAGTAVPTQVREDRLLKDRSTWQNPS